MEIRLLKLNNKVISVERQFINGFPVDYVSFSRADFADNETAFTYSSNEYNGIVVNTDKTQLEQLTALNNALYKLKNT